MEQLHQVLHCWNEPMQNSRTFRPWLLALTAAMAGAAAAAATHAEPATAGAGASRGEGIWKAVVPPKSMRGEFNSFDPIGVAAGARIKADCSLNWINPDDGKLYCFSSGTSLEFFLDMPHAHLERARAEWRRMSAPPR
jgi:hypothetical protein